MKQTLSLIILATLPLTAQAQSLQGLMAGTLTFINGTLIPVLLGLAFVFFIINIIRYFILGAENKEIKEDAKSVALYSVGAFVFLVIFWGLVNMLAESTGLEDGTAITPDYVR